MIFKSNVFVKSTYIIQPTIIIKDYDNAIGK